MENIIDMIAKDSEPAKVSDELKDLLYQKAAKRIEDLRPSVGNAMFQTYRHCKMRYAVKKI